MPLVRDGLNFTAGGAIWKYRGITGFRAPELYAKGESGILDDYYGWARSLGANIVRVFAIWNNTRYGPKTQPNYYDDLERAAEHAKAAGLYWHLVGLCDMKPTNPDVYLNVSEQRQHLEKLVAISARVGNVLFEISNEDTDPDSGGTAHLFPASMFAGVLATRSTWFGDDDPQKPGAWLDWVTVHTPRDADFAVKGKVLHEAQRQGLGPYPPAFLPAVSGEPIRIAEGTTPRQHADDALVCELFGAGRCIHGGFSTLNPSHQSDLQNCRVPTGEALACAEAVGVVWLSGLIDPTLAAEGRYVRGQADGGGDCPIVHRDREDGQPGARRSYFMQKGTRMTGGPIDATPGWPIVPRDGWRLTTQGGYQGNVLVLER